MKTIILLFLLSSLSACHTSNIVTEASTANSLPRQMDKHYVLQVKGGYDDVCQREIEDAAKYLDGVRFVYWIQGKQILLIDFDESKTSIDSISLAIAKRGYDTELHKADDWIYKTLAFQCEYR